MRFFRNSTLAQMCLHVIIEDLDKYIYKSSRVIPQKLIDFLLRVYSEECFLQYSKSHRMVTEECMLWFLSPHNKNVFLSRVKVTQNIIRKLQDVGPVITSLTLTEIRISEDMLNAVMSLIPHVLYLDLSGADCSDKTLLCIGQMCPKLVTLYLKYCSDITDDGISNLCSNNLLLKHLNIYLTPISYEGLFVALTRMPSLVHLEYENIAFGIFTIYKHHEMYFIENNIRYNLFKLVYTHTRSKKFKDVVISEVIHICTELCPNIEEFHLYIPEDPNVLELCSKFWHLKKLRLCFHHFSPVINISDALTPILPLANNLITLELYCQKIPPATLIENFKNLKELKLEDVYFTDYREEEIKFNHTNLETLKIINLDISEETTYNFLVLLISLSKNVTSLTIQRNSYCPYLGKYNDLIDFIQKSMKSLSSVDLLFIGSRKLPPSSLNFLKIPSMKQIIVIPENQWFRSAYVARQCSISSWQMTDDEIMIDEFSCRMYLS